MAPPLKSVHTLARRGRQTVALQPSRCLPNQPWGGARNDYFYSLNIKDTRGIGVPWPSSKHP